MTNPDDQQFIVYTEWNNKLIYYKNGLKHIDTYKIKKKNGTRYYYILGNQTWSGILRKNWSIDYTEDDYTTQSMQKCVIKETSSRETVDWFVHKSDFTRYWIILTPKYNKN